MLSKPGDSVHVDFHKRDRLKTVGSRQLQHMQHSGHSHACLLILSLFTRIALAKLKDVGRFRVANRDVSI